MRTPTWRGSATACIDRGEWPCSALDIGIPPSGSRARFPSTRRRRWSPPPGTTRRSWRRLPRPLASTATTDYDAVLGARRRGHRAHRGAGRRDSPPGDSRRARRQAHHPRQADGDDRGRGRPDGRRGACLRSHLRGVSGVDAAARRRAQGAHRRGEFGDLAVLHQTSRWSIAEDWYQSGTPGWFVDPAQVPGGAFIDEGIYWIDLFRWLAAARSSRSRRRPPTWSTRTSPSRTGGWRRSPSPTASTRRLKPPGPSTRRDRPALRPNTTASSGSRSSARAASTSTSGSAIPGGRCCAAGADNWVFERQAEPPFSAVTPFPLDHLIDCLESGRPSPANIDEARKSFVVAMAAYQSAREGRPVHLSW